MLELSIYICAAEYYKRYYRTFNQPNGWAQGLVGDYDEVFNYRNDVLCGFAIDYFSDGSIRRLRNYQNSSLYGININFDDNEVNHWRNGDLHGIEINYYVPGIIQAVRYWRNHIQYGIEIDYWSEDVIAKLLQWDNDQKHGIQISYYRSSGQIRHLQHRKNGLLHGIEIKCRLDGSQRITRWYKDKKLNFYILE